LRVVDHREVLRIIAAGGQIVDVLPAHEYRVAAVRGAIHLPLPRLLHDAERILDTKRPVVVYCRDCL
jgi:rhodanese-related sulfurtransferase